MQRLELPEPNSEEKRHSAQLLTRIKQRIEQAGGWIDFAEYMSLALYEPGLGYYSSTLQKLGERGDFMTAPEVSPLFAQALAKPVTECLQNMQQADVVEFGAGSGKLAADLLLQLQANGCVPRHYYIVELSGALKQRQQETIHAVAGDLLQRVVWLDTLPQQKLNAAIIANEVLDAMPVQRFSVDAQGIRQLGVVIPDDLLCLQSRPANAELIDQVQHVQQDLGRIFPAGYHSELNPNIQPWLNSIAQWLEQGVMYVIDYGYPRGEYYLPERRMGTYMGYYRHRAFDDPLWYPGLQDMTAFVDFTALAEAALACGFEMVGFSPQGAFLMDCGLLQSMERVEDERQRLSLAQQVKTLALAGEMGERFKVMGLAMNMDAPVTGFRLGDCSYRL